MKSQVFINLPVSDLEKSTQLYKAMGFSLNLDFSNDSARCLVFSDTIYLMIMTKERFASFATKPLADTKNGLAGIFALSLENVAKVNEIADSAIIAGGIEPKPLQDHGFMQLRTIEDFDGHTWELFYMDMSKMPQH